ncbi:glycosyltransferase family 2 protein [uncultured Chloroflexus sp.]|uniref:glycosyltransferase family 2 protein n=1 Tax=uncultured Chloroflexus sp. TaxID=214040 RepID=UPI002637550D|nr:glycosyltransferase family 2 protein [uncultured Chloroflexus sp.]
MTVPRISIILPIRNAATTLPACLRSLARQRFTDYEVLAIDDGSDDESPAIVAAAAAGDARIVPIKAGRIGLTAALNLGLALARAPIIARMDADDVMHPDRLALQYQALMAQPQLALIASRVVAFPAREVRAGLREYLRWQNRVLTPEQVAAEIYVESPFAHPSVMFRCDAVQRLGGYTNEPWPEDYELWLRMHAAGLQMAKLPRNLLAWRERPDRATRTDPRYARAAFDELRACFLANDPRLHSGRALVYWGAGRVTRRRARRLIERGFPPAAWIDIDPAKIGQTIWGAPVHAPKWLDRQPRPFVLVYVTNHGARDLIDGWLAEMGYQPGRDYLSVG